MESIVHEIKTSSSIVIVDEGRKTGSISEELITLLSEEILLGKSISRLNG